MGQVSHSRVQDAREDIPRHQLPEVGFRHVIQLYEMGFIHVIQLHEMGYRHDIQQYEMGYEQVIQLHEVGYRHIIHPLLPSQLQGSLQASYELPLH